MPLKQWITGLTWNIMVSRMIEWLIFAKYAIEDSFYNLIMKQHKKRASPKQ